MKNAGDEDATH